MVDPQNNKPSDIINQLLESFKDIIDPAIQTYKKDPKEGKKLLIGFLGKKNAHLIEPYIIKMAGIELPKNENPRDFDKLEIAELVHNTHQEGIKYSEICKMFNFDQDRDYEYIRYLDKWYVTTVLPQPEPKIKQEAKPKEDKKGFLSRLLKR